MTAVRKPQDRKPKADARAKDVDEETSEQEDRFRFTHKGIDYELAPHDEVLTAGYARKNRHKTLDDQFFSMLELLADDEALAAIDSMKKPEFLEFQETFIEYLGIDLGESKA